MSKRGEYMINAEFLKAIEDKKYVNVTFFSRKDRAVVTKKFVPIDYGPSKKEKVPTDRYHFYSTDEAEGFHTVSVLPENLQSIEILYEHFDPAQYVTWTPIVWSLKRNWGKYS